MKPLDPRLLPHLTPARLPLAGVVAASTLSGVLLIGQAFAVATLVTSLFAGAGSGSWDSAMTAGLALGAVTLGRAGTSWLVDVLSARASAHVTAALRRRLLKAALDLGPYAFSRRRVGEVALLATRGVSAVDPYLTRYLPTLVVAAVLPTLTVVTIATQDPLSALIVLATLPLVPVFAVLVGLATRERAQGQWQTLSLLSGHFVDVMRGLPTLVAFRRAKAQSASIRAVTNRYRRATHETLKLAFASSAVLELVATISVALVAVTVGLRLSGGSLDLRTALVVLLLAPEAYWPLRRVGAEFHAAAEGTATFEDAEELLRAAERVRPAVRVIGAPDLRGRPEIRVAGLTTGYPNRPEPVLEAFDAVFTRGVTAVVGPSGSGKSTLLAALMGHLPLQEGQIVVGDRHVDPTSTQWRRQIAWVPQRPWIAAASVLDNVRIGRPDATVLEVWAALRRVALDEAVANLPDGVYEVLGEDGAGLSAGERARLALARAVVAARPVVLLDEPAAHLDPLTEAMIAKTVTTLGQTSCVVLVAHRESLMAVADHVVEVPQRGGSSVAPTPSYNPTAPRQTDDAPLPPRHFPRHFPRRPDVAAPTVRGASAAVAGARSTSGVPADERSDSAAQAPGGHLRVRLAIGSMLGAMAAGSGVALTATAGWLIARAAEHPPVLVLMVAIVGVRAFGLARPAFRYAERLVSHDVALRLLADRRVQVYDALVPLVPGRLGRQRGDVLASVVDDVDSLVDRHLRVQAPWASYTGVALLATGFAAWVLPAAGVVTGLTLLVGGGSAYVLGRVGVARAEDRFVGHRALLSAAVVHALQGATDLVMWQTDRRAVEHVDAVASATSHAAVRSARAVAGARVLALATCGSGVLGVAWVGGPALAEGRLSAPMLALLLLLPLALLEVVSPLADAGALQVRVSAAERRLAGLAGTSPAVKDPAAPMPPPPLVPTPRVTADRVAAGWSVVPAFRDLSLDLPPGSRVGVVGPSGSGKSTLAAVLMRFLDPVAGTVSIAGVPTTSLMLDDVRRCVGLVDDDPHIFSSSVYENVRLARPAATEREVALALRAVQLGSWLDALPDGLASTLGEGHAHVSGGERARVGMARAVLADLPVLVLDEPTAHLDTPTAQAVAADLLDASSGRSVVWITHGTVGLDRVDRVLDLGSGRESTGSGGHLTESVLSG